MKKIFQKVSLTIFSTVLPILSIAQIQFKDYFQDKTMHFVYTIDVDNRKMSQHSTEWATTTLQWSGNTTNLTEIPVKSDTKVTITDIKTQQIIYASSYHTLLDEWLTIDDSKGKQRTVKEGVSLPLPKKPVVIDIYKLDPDSIYKKVVSRKFSIRDNDKINGFDSKLYSSKKMLESGNPKNKIDILIVPQGYSKDSLTIFETVAENFVKELLNYEPFKSNADKFNIRTSSGVDSQSLDFQFGTFGMERYLTTWKPLQFYQLSDKPYEIVLVFVNSNQYGGSGFYNGYAAFTGQNYYSIVGMIHEFGHLFANLDDEYEGDVLITKQRPDSKCIMRTLDEHQFCPDCQNKLLKIIKYWTE